MKKILLSGLLALLFATSSFALPQPQIRVKQMVDSVLDVLKRTDISDAEKQVLVSGRMQSYLDMKSISRRTLGPYWDGATEEQRERFAKLLVQILEGTYLHRMDDYGGGATDYLKQRVKGHKAIVDTLVHSEGLEIPVQYKMVYEDGDWQIFDLVLEGISLVKNYRASYGEIIRRKGLDELLTMMDDKIVEMNKPR